MKDLKSKSRYLDIVKLKTFPIDLKSDVVSIKSSKKDCVQETKYESKQFRE